MKSLFRFALVALISVSGLRAANVTMADYNQSRTPAATDRQVGYRPPMGSGAELSFTLAQLKTFFQSGLVIGTDVQAFNTNLNLWAALNPSAKADTSHTHTVSQLSDASTLGRSIMQAADRAALMLLIGSGGGGSTKVLREDGAWVVMSGGSATTDASLLTSGLLAPARINATHSGLQVVRMNSVNNALEYATVAVGAGDMLAANNGSDFANPAAVRVNLGIGSILMPGWVDVTSPTYGAKGNAKVVTDAAMTASSATLTSSSASFASGDVGKSVCINGAGSAGSRLSATISGFTNTTTVTLSAAASTTVSSAYCAFGTDSTTAFQAALGAAVSVVYVPSGNYFFAGSIGAVPANVSIVGAGFMGPHMSITTTDGLYTPTNHVSPMSGGATFVLTANAGSGSGTKFISLSDNSSVVGVTFYWPNQLASAATPTAYPWAIYLGTGAGSSVRFCDFVNAYQAIYIENTVASLVEEVRGSALFRGIKCEGNYDVTRLRGVHFGAAFDTATVGLYQKANSIAFDIGRNDLLIAESCFAFYYKTWMHFYNDSSHDTPPGGGGGPTAAWAQIRGGGGDLISRGIWIEQVQPQGIDIDGAHLASNSGDNLCVQIDSSNTGSVRIHNSMMYNSLGTFGTVAGSGEVTIDGSYCFGSLTGGVAGTTFGTTGWAVTGTGNFALRNCNFRTIQTHVSIGASINRAVIVGNLASGAFAYSNGISDAAVIASNTTTPTAVGPTFNDTMTGSGYLLSHTADTGQAWGLLDTTAVHTAQLSSGSAYGASTGGAEEVVNFTPASADHEASITVVKGSITGSPEIGIWLRATTGTGTFPAGPRAYMCRYVEGSGFQFFRIDGTDGYVQIGSNTTGTLSNGDVLRATVSGTSTVTLTLYKNGTSVATVNDTNANRVTTNGKIGIHLYDPSSGSGNYRIDTFTSP